MNSTTDFHFALKTPCLFINFEHILSYFELTQNGVNYTFTWHGGREKNYNDKNYLREGSE